MAMSRRTASSTTAASSTTEPRHGLMEHTAWFHGCDRSPINQVPRI
ncbi:MAG: hypothetical protein AAGI69_10010 [Cyanobacteria bacterium P01_H01_bin.21]